MHDYHPNIFILTVAVHVIKFKMARLFLIKGTPYSNSKINEVDEAGKTKVKLACVTH